MLTRSVVTSFSIVLLVTCGFPSFSQTAPVSATLQLTPPYSVYLSDYAVAGNEQMKLNLLLRDLTEPSYEVKLHLTVEGAGIRIETNPSFNPQPIFLEGGVPTILGAEDLAPYLDSRNLIFSGITRQQYDQRAALPEGFYRFCFRVIDYRRRDVELARETCANAWFVLNDPPRINTPLCGTILPLRDPQNIYFQWLAMNSVSPNAALTTEHEFTLSEIRPAGRNPNDVINTSVPIYQTTIQETNLLYGITEPPLIPGQEYVFRIRAKDINGRDLFKNQGYSEVCTFKFGEGNLITPPEQVNVYPETESRARVTWFMNLETDRYKVEYRKKVNPTETENAWFTKETIDDYTLLNDLQPDTEYEVRVAGIYRTFTSHPTETKTFRTPQQRVFACGQEAPVSIPPDTKPLITAMVGQRWKIGQFEMEVVSVQGGSGVFTGIGAVIIPYLGFRVYSKFEKLKVNENQEVVQGDVIALSEDWEVFKQNWQPEDPTPDVEEGQEPAENAPPVFVGVDVPFEGEIDSVYVNPDGDIVIINEEGEETVIDQPVNAETGEPENTRITDSSGQQWVVSKDPNTGETSVTRVAEGSGNTGDNTTVQTDLIKDRIIVLILEQFEEEIAAWLRINGKGGEDDPDVLLAEELPVCFPRKASVLAHISEKTIQYFKQYPYELRRKIESDPTDKDLVNNIADSFSNVGSVTWNTLPQEDQEGFVNVTCTAIVIADLEIYKTELLNEIGLENEGTDCFGQGWDRAKELYYDDYELGISSYAGFIRFLQCRTDKENCGSGNLSSFSCGMTNGLLQELDWVALLEGEGLTKEDFIELILCVKDEFPIGGRVEDNPDLYKVLFKCITGVELGDLGNAVGDFITENWDEPYYQGQATAFVVTLLSPFKAKIIEKLRSLPKYASKISKFEALSRARNADELVSLSKTLLNQAGDVGTYTTKIKWGILDVDARPFGDKGYWGKRIGQNNSRVDAFEIKINPNNESFYVEHPNGGFVQFENLKVNALQDGKMVLQPNNSMYRVYDKPEFLRQKVLDEAIRQTQAANGKGLTVEWLVSDQTAVHQLTQFFAENNVNILVKYLGE